MFVSIILGQIKFVMEFKLDAYINNETEVKLLADRGGGDVCFPNIILYFHSWPFESKYNYNTYYTLNIFIGV